MSSSAAARAFVDEVWNRAFLPPPQLTVWQWADAHRTLSTKESGVPGPWRTERVPYLRKPMEVLSPASPAELVVLMKGAQIGGTECGLNWLGFTIDHDPCPFMVVFPTIEMARALARQRLDEMLRQNPALKAKVAARRDPEGSSTQLWRDFPGGMVVMRGANSPSGLRSTPIKKLHLSEVDAYPPSAGEEGDPIVLARQRTQTFRRRKELIESTPGRAGSSRIQREFTRCEQAWDFHLPCPHCGFAQQLTWDRLRYELPAGWTHENDSAELVSVPGVEYACVKCTKRIPEHKKVAMLDAGAWVERWHRGEKSVAFHLSSLYSPWFSWGRCVAMYERGKQRPEEMQVFINTVLGLPYEEPSEAPDWSRLYARRESYRRGTVPPGVRFLTAGVDVQRDRLEVELVGWGREKRSWSVDYRVLHGDTADLGGADSPWRQLEDLLADDYPCAGGGTIPIWCLAVDSGDSTQTVYAWARGKQPPAFGGNSITVRHPRTVMVCKGRDVWGTPLLPPVKASAEEKKRGLKVVGVGVSGLKRELYLWLRLRGATREERDSGIEDPYGFCHFPEYDEHFFRGLTAERIKTVRNKGGYEKEEWVRQNYQRNEPLDCRNLARAASLACGLDRLTERDWARLEAGIPAGLLAQPGTAPVSLVALAEDGPLASAVPAPSRVRQRSVIRSQWMGRYR